LLEVKSHVSLSDSAVKTALHPLASDCHFLWGKTTGEGGSGSRNPAAGRRKKLIFGGNRF
jgi:hypothetical protein